MFLDSVKSHKQESGYFKQMALIKFCVRSKKSKVEMIATLKDATDAKIIRETLKIFGSIPKEEFENTIKKMGRKNGSMFSCKQTVFRERKHQMHGLGM